MNSSGIKRGLAAGAISALAVTGLPFFASSASAATGDSISVSSVGPTLNGGSIGGVVVLKTKGVDPSKLDLANTALNGGPNSPTQTVSIVGTPTIVADKGAGDSNPNDGLDEITMHIAVTTPSAGDSATFAVYEDEDGSKSVQASEARQQVTMSTSGAIDSIELTPASQTTSTGQKSGAYTVTIKDAADRVTQLAGGDSLDVSADNGSTPSATSLSAGDLDMGTDTFTVTGGSAGKTTVTVADHNTPTIKKTAELQVAPAAALDADNVNVVTGADSWSDFGDNDNGTTLVRVDQSSLRLDFQGTTAHPNKDAVVVLSVTKKSGNVTLDGGKTSTTATTTLDDNGAGSIPITLDAGTVRENDVITVSDGNGFSQDFKFVKAAPSSISATSRYFGAFNGSVTVDATVLDQFGLPVTSGYVTAQRTGANTDATPQKQPVGADGKVSFTFADSKAKDNPLTKRDTVTLTYFADQYTTNPGPSKTVTIDWSADGKGSDYGTSLNGKNTDDTTYDPAKNSIIPLADAIADTTSGAYDEVAELAVSGAEHNQAITVSVDNGALILKSGDNKLSQGVSSIDAMTDNNGNLSGYKIIGTKSGLVTVTISSANRTETSQFTVAKQTDSSTARNVTVSGPAEVEHGTTQIPFTAVVTDAFGNPVPGVPVQALNVQVSGPAQYQDGDVQTNDAGQITLNVRVDSDASGPVSIKVTGLPDTTWYGGAQFGAGADELSASSNSKDAPGLPASSNVGTATTTVKEGTTPTPPQVHSIGLILAGSNNAADDDNLRANAKNNASGLVATLYKQTANGWKMLKSATLNSKGNHRFKVADTNGKAYTKYQVRVAATDTTQAENANRKVR